LPSLPGATSLQLGDIIPLLSDSFSNTVPEGPWYWAPDGDPNHSQLTWDGITQWGPIPGLDSIIDEVKVVNDVFTATVEAPLTWNVTNWDQEVWG
jgi:hypothetical protein